MEIQLFSAIETCCKSEKVFCSPFTDITLQQNTPDRVCDELLWFEITKG